MYALIEFKGKQYKAEKDARIKVDRIDAKNGDKVELDKVLLVSSDGKVKVGSPYVKGAKVSTVVDDELVKDKKIRVFKYKRRKGYRRTRGHRQQYTLLKVQDIIGA
jgi:large subunit ribosomal protein L21